MKKPHNIIISISSDIGYELAKDWLGKGYSVSGTFRTRTGKCNELEELGAKIFHCDLDNSESIENAIHSLNKLDKWNSLVIAVGSLDPIGNFLDSNFNEWVNSIDINFKYQLKFIHGMMDKKNDLNSSVLFFAGGGTNSATTGYSAYTVSKIALIKMVELLDKEINETSFSILGPGWVNTKIHNSTLQLKDKTDTNYKKTVDMLERDGEKCFPMEKVIECCNWILTSSKELVGGRNFSCVHDPWETEKIKIISQDPNLFKLRRFGNEIFLKDKDDGKR